MRNKKSSFSVNGKGYYIALILCAAAIGISGYLYYRNTNQPEDTLNTPVSDTLADSNIQTAATGNSNTLSGKPEETTENAPTKPGKITRPVSGDTIANYAMDCLSYNQTTRDWRVHDGIDIAAQAGTAVGAAADGKVYTVYEDETMGHTVVIRHDGGYATKYASLNADICVKAGDTVTAGQTIGYVGCSALLETAIGDHVHFSVTCDGEALNPEDFLKLS